MAGGENSTAAVGGDDGTDDDAAGDDDVGEDGCDDLGGVHEVPRLLSDANGLDDGAETRALLDFARSSFVFHRCEHVLRS